MFDSAWVEKGSVCPFTLAALLLLLFQSTELFTRTLLLNHNPPPEEVASLSEMVQEMMWAKLRM